MKAKMKYVEEYVGTAPKEKTRLTDRYIKVLESFSRHNFDRILDIGCGNGAFSVLLKDVCNAKEIYGIEISEKGVKSAIAKGIKAFRLNIDTDYLPFEEKWFDAVFAGEVVEHLFDPDHLLNEVHRVLKPKGIFLLSTPNLSAIHNRIALLFGYQPFPLSISARANVGRMYEPRFEPQSLDHVRAFTLRGLKELLMIHGFEILQAQGCGAMLPRNMRLKRVFKTLDRFFSLFPSLSYRVILKCLKK